MLYSQSISMVAVNIITYFQISVIGRDFMKVIPMIYMTAADLIIISVWIFCNNRIYLKLYPPRKLIIVYGSRNAETLTNKMSKREDKYMICESISIKEDFSRIKNEISRYDGVIICDISGKLRNDIIKYCFEKSKRIYISPKISDIIIRAERISGFLIRRCCFAETKDYPLISVCSKEYSIFYFPLSDLPFCRQFF